MLDDDEKELAVLQQGVRILLAFWRNPDLFEPSEFDVLGAIQGRLWATGADLVQMSRAELMKEAKISQATAARAVRRLIEKGLLARHDMGHKKPFAYSINHDALARLTDCQ